MAGLSVGLFDDACGWVWCRLCVVDRSFLPLSGGGGGGADSGSILPSFEWRAVVVALCK